VDAVSVVVGAAVIVGSSEGCNDGWSELVSSVGNREGPVEGAMVGDAVGDVVGDAVGDAVGGCVGEVVVGVRLCDGTGLGAMVGAEVSSEMDTPSTADPPSDGRSPVRIRVARATADGPRIVTLTITLPALRLSEKVDSAMPNPAAISVLIRATRLPSKSDNTPLIWMLTVRTGSLLADIWDETQHVTVDTKPAASTDESLVKTIVMPLPLEMTALGNVSPVSDCRSGELVERPS